MATKRIVKTGPGSKVGTDGRKTAARKKTAPKTASGVSPAISKPAKKTPMVAGKASKPSAASKQTAKRGVGGKAPAAKSATKKPVRKSVKASPVPTKRPASKQAASKQAVAKKASKTAPPKKPAVKKAVVKKTAANTPAPIGATAKPRKITPKQALANTRKLLKAKQAHDRQPQPWQTLDPEHDHVPQSGFQSPEAAQKAEELHAGESRMQAIQGSIGTQDRHAQGKRDSR